MAALLATWPTCLHPAQRLVGSPLTDLYLGVWGFWWYGQTLPHLTSPLATPLLDYPYGGVLFVADPLNALLSVPLQTVMPLPLAYNAIIVGQLVFAGLAAFALLRYLRCTPTAAFVGGLVYGFNPYVLGYVHNAVSQEVSVGWFPLFVLRLLVALRRPTRANHLLAGGALALGIMSSWYHAACLMLLLPMLLWPWWRRRDRRALRSGVLTALLGLVLAAPYLYAQLYVLSHPDTIEIRTTRAFGEALDSQRGSDVERWLRPGKDPSLLVRGYYHQPYLGLLAVLLTLVALIKGWRRSFATRTTAVVLMAFAVLGMGYYLQVADHDVTVAGHLVPMPFLLMHRFVPGFSWLNFPHRFLVPALLALACLAARGMAEVQVHLPRPVALLVGVNVAAAVLGEYLLLSPLPYPLPSAEAADAPFYERVAAMPGRFGIIDLPTVSALDIGLSKRFVYLQTLHGKGVPYALDVCIRAPLSGAFGRQPTMTRLAAVTELPDYGFRSQSPRQAVDTLRALGYRYVVLHGECLVRESEWAIEDVLGAAVARPRREGSLIIYDLSRLPRTVQAMGAAP